MRGEERRGERKRDGGIELDETSLHYNFFKLVTCQPVIERRAYRLYTTSYS